MFTKERLIILIIYINIISCFCEYINFPSKCCVDYYDNIYNNGVNTCGHGDRESGTTFASRSPGVGVNGMASSSQPLVSQNALKILQMGGNAVDAAIAANIMQTLVEPMSNGIGGDLFSIIYNPSDKKLYGYNGSGRSSMNFTLQQMIKAVYEENGSNYIPSLGPYSITIPGALQGWCDIHDKFGKLDWKLLFEDTINYADNGFVVTEIIADYWRGAYNEYQHTSAIDELTTNGKYPDATKGWQDIYTINGEYPREGDVFKNKVLADVYRQIAKDGCNAFYRGNLTSIMVEYLQSVGSSLTIQDFNMHYGEWVDPVNVTYRENWLVSELPPNPQGIAALQMLNMMELFPFGTNESFNLHTTDYIHASVEIKKLAFADRAKYYADSSYKDVCVPVTTLISKEYAQERYQLINMNKAATYDPPGNITCIDGKTKEEFILDKHEEGDTIYLTVADGDGMMVSWIQSNYNGFGSGLVSPKLGFAFQDRGALFSLNNGTNNCYNTGKRPFHTIMPGFLSKKNLETNEWDPYMSFGVMGGYVQPQGHVQIVSNIVDFGMNVQEAGDAARWCHSGSQQPTGQPMNPNGGTVLLESGICITVANELIDRGHVVEYQPNGGGYQGIFRNHTTGVLFGGTEMRKDGIALGY